MLLKVRQIMDRQPQHYVVSTKVYLIRVLHDSWLFMVFVVGSGKGLVVFISIFFGMDLFSETGRRV